MGKFIAVLGGLIAMVGGVCLVLLEPQWRHAFKVVVQGFIPPILFFGGLIALIAGISSMRDAARTKKLEEEAEKK
jgi:uncharacterized membrane protein